MDKTLKRATAQIRAFAAVADRELRGVAEQTTALSNVGQSGPGAAARWADPCVDPSMAPADRKATEIPALFSDGAFVVNAEAA